MSIATNLRDDTWRVLTDGTNSGWLTAPVGSVVISIGTTAPGADDAGHPNREPDVQVQSPVKAWYRRAPGSGTVQTTLSNW